METKMSVGDFLNFGFENAKKHFLKFFLANILCGFIMLVLVLIGMQTSTNTLIVLVTVGSISLSIGFFQNTMNMILGKPFDYRAFLPQPIVFVNYLIAMIIVTVLLVVGFLLLIIPGLILTPMLVMVPYLVLYEKLNFVMAIKESIARSHGYKMDIFFGILVADLVAVLLGLTIIGAIFAIPFFHFAAAYPYCRITGKLEQRAIEA